MAISKALLEELDKMRATARTGGGEDKLEARRKKGVMTARDRLKELGPVVTALLFAGSRYGTHF